MKERPASGFIRFDVILNGGEATVRDRRSAAGIDVVYGNAPEARSVLDLRDCISALSTAYGPSEGYRPAQDDIANKTSRISRIKKAFDPRKYAGPSAGSPKRCDANLRMQS